LAFNRLSFASVLIVLTAAAFTLAACGRNGPPLPPPGSTPTPTASATPSAGTSPTGAPGADGPTPQQTAQKNGFDMFGNPVAPPGQKKSFLLDPLLMQ
jgi:predicted small lipoprotein YifL